MTDKLFKTGRAMYLLGIAELAIYNFFKGDFAMTRPKQFPEALQFVNPALAYISGTLLLLAVVVFFLNRYRFIDLSVIVGLVFLLATTRHIYNLWQDSINAYKSLWLIGGAFLIMTTLPRLKKYKKEVLWANLVVLFLFFVDCGFAHFQYTDFVKNLILPFIPFRLFWTYFAAVCLILGGIGLLIPPTQKLAALLSGIQIAGWFVLLHVPRALTLHGDEWIGVGESLAISGICFMIYCMLKEKKQEGKKLSPS
jgi:hypothetical protein